MFRSRIKYPAYRLDCCGDEDVVNSLDRGLKIRILHTDDDVETAIKAIYDIFITAAI